MNNTGSTISHAMQEAIKDGSVVEPVALLSLIAEIENPIAALSDHDQGNELFTAFYQDFSFIKAAMATQRLLILEEHNRLVCLLRWFIVELRQWRSTDDANDRKLTALFVTAQACDRDHEIWSMIPTNVRTNGDLTDRLKVLIGSFIFTMRVSDRTHLWELKAIENLRLAEARNDWVAIGAAWQPFAHAILPNVLQMQVVRCLLGCDITFLSDALKNTNQTAIGMLIASTLSTSEKLDLAVASTNPYIQFSCLYQTLSNHRTPKQLLSSEQEQLLTKLLLKVADDVPRWDAWMQVFNAYPLRHPALQTALGIALADGPDTAIEPYVQSIVLYPKQTPADTGRQAVAVCLRAFRSKALQPRRETLWTLAHKRWTDWEFNKAETDQHLFSINWSELDYAIVGYACECLDVTELNDAMNQIIMKLQLLEESWHASTTDIITSWNRLLSTFQPYAHAQVIIAQGDDWLNDNRQYQPFDPANNQYTVMKYKMT